MSIRRNIYRLLRISNDINAIRRGRFGRRIRRRATWRILRRIFK